MRGMPPADRRLEQQVDACGLRHREQLGADVGQQLLVGGHHRLAGLERVGDQLTGGLDAAEHLDHQVDRGVGDDAAGLGGEDVGGEVDATLLGQAADGDARSPRDAGRCGPRWLPTPHARAGTRAAPTLPQPSTPRLIVRASTAFTLSVGQLHRLNRFRESGAQRDGIGGELGHLHGRCVAMTLGEAEPGLRHRLGFDLGLDSLDDRIELERRPTTSATMSQEPSRPRVLVDLAHQRPVDLHDGDRQLAQPPPTRCRCRRSGRARRGSRISVN